MPGAKNGQAAFFQRVLITPLALSGNVRRQSLLSPPATTPTVTGFMKITSRCPGKTVSHLTELLFLGQGETDETAAAMGPGYGSKSSSSATGFELGHDVVRDTVRIVG